MDLVLAEVTPSAELRQGLGCKLFLWEMMLVEAERNKEDVKV